jgi:hypothetical protein
MDNESTQDEQGIIADEPTIDTNKTVDGVNLVSGNEFLDNEHENTPTQMDSSPVEAQYAAGRTSSPAPQRNVTRIVLYAVFLLIGIVLGAVGVLLIQLSIGGGKAPIPISPSPVASGNVTVHADQSIIIPLLQNSVQQIDLPANGSVSNVQI